MRAEGKAKMSIQSDLVSRLAGRDGGEPIFVPDLTLWRRRNHRRGTLPARYADWSLPEICRDLGVPIWSVVRPWRMQLLGLDSQERESETERVRSVETIAGVLTWRWERAPDGAWRQVGYPVKSAADLPAAVEWSRALEYVLDTEGLTELEMAIGADGLLAIELPPRPLMHIVAELLGWGDKLALLQEPAIEHLTQHLENRLQPLITALAQTSVAVHVAPDSLGDTAISETLFRQQLLPSYRRTIRELHDYHKRLVVQARGPIAGLLDGLARAGVDAVAGFACPLDGEGGLAELYALANQRMTLWGGLPQEVFLPETDETTFVETVRRTARIAQGRRRLILGVAGGVPAQADLARVQATAQIIREAVA
jgi:hypothetical protein